MMKMTCKEYKEDRFEKYLTPSMSVVDIQVEGVLCGSNETLDDYLGDW